MDERLRWVARLPDGEKMAAVCRDFDISRKTGYKIFQRYKDCGLDGLTDRSRRSYRHANRLPFQIEKLIVQLKRERPSWGAPKIREKLRRAYSEVQTSAISTVHAVLHRHGLATKPAAQNVLQQQAKFDDTNPPAPSASSHSAPSGNTPVTAAAGSRPLLHSR